MCESRNFAKNRQCFSATSKYLLIVNPVYIFFHRLKASLNQYKGFTDDEECTQLEKMILVLLCSKIMNVSANEVRFNQNSFLAT